MPGLGHDPVTISAAVGHDRDRCSRAAADSRTASSETGISEGEDPAIGRHHEIAAPVR